MQVGVDPASEMVAHARDRGIDVVKGVAEALLFPADTFDTALIVTTICFVDDISRTITEARRVLRPDGSLVIGYIDEDSPVGRRYREEKDDNPFYRDAKFVSTDELIDELEGAGFSDFEFVQTIYQWPTEIDGLEPIDEGYGEGLVRRNRSGSIAGNCSTVLVRRWPVRSGIVRTGAGGPNSCSCDSAVSGNRTVRYSPALGGPSSLGVLWGGVDADRFVDRAFLGRSGHEEHGGNGDRNHSGNGADGPVPGKCRNACDR